MARERVARTLEHLVRALESERFHPLDTKARAELRALLGVYRAARGCARREPDGSWMWMGGDDFDRLVRALSRVESLSRPRPRSRRKPR